jgi:DNA polymerase-4
MEHLVFHVDVNSAFLSWSAVKRLQDDPKAVDLRTIPSAVGGDVQTRHGVITAKSIPAKKYGIQTGEPVVKALQKCPGLVLVQSDFQTYRTYSRAFTAVLRKYAKTVEQVSIDEAFMDMSALLLTDTDPVRKAGEIKDEIRDTLGFTVNVGISVNRLLAKMASDLEKPDRIHTLWPEEIPEKMWPLPIGNLYGCGAKTAEKLQTLGIVRIGDAAAADPVLLRSYLGEKAGDYIFCSANGIGDAEISDAEEDAKSYSNETTLASDITAGNYAEDAPPVLKELSDSVAGRLKKDGVFARTITVSVKTDGFRRHSRQAGLTESTNDPECIRREAEQLLRQLLFGQDSQAGLFEKGDRIRLIGVGATNLDRREYRQLSLFDFLQNTVPDEKEDDRKKRLAAMLGKIRTQYGEKAVRRGSTLLREKEESPEHSPKHPDVPEG